MNFMDRRHFTKAMGAVVAGMAAGSKVFAEEKKAPAAADAAPKDTHVCKGMNDCKGKGGCASDAAKHACKGKNECKGMGGCAAGGSCAGKNDCKGKGGCAVPVNKAHMKADDKAGKHACKGKGGCKGR
jgi:hypothetical protein